LGSKRRSARYCVALLNCARTHAHTHICIFIYTCIYMHICIYISKIYVNICMYIYIYSQDTHTYIYICVYIYTYIYTYTEDTVIFTLQKMKSVFLRGLVKRSVHFAISHPPQLHYPLTPCEISVLMAQYRP
jgi:hypothetical protein